MAKETAYKKQKGLRTKKITESKIKEVLAQIETVEALGLLVVKKFMDTVEYEFHDELNFLTLKKQINEVVSDFFKNLFAQLVSFQ